jgi:hypothetical protein
MSGDGECDQVIGDSLWVKDSIWFMSGDGEFDQDIVDSLWVSDGD